MNRPVIYEMRGDETIDEYLRREPVVVPPGGSPFEDTVQVPPGQEHLAIEELMPRMVAQDPTMRADWLRQVSGFMARKVADHIIQHFDPVEIIEQTDSGLTVARLSITLRVENTVKRIAEKHLEQGRSEGLVEGRQEEKARNRDALMRYLASEGLL